MGEDGEGLRRCDPRHVAAHLVGDPGKVSDAEYFCDTGDGGGVHSK